MTFDILDEVHNRFFWARLDAAYRGMPNEEVSDHVAMYMAGGAL